MITSNSSLDMHGHSNSWTWCSSVKSLCVCVRAHVLLFVYIFVEAEKSGRSVKYGALHTCCRAILYNYNPLQKYEGAAVSYTHLCFPYNQQSPHLSPPHPEKITVLLSDSHFIPTIPQICDVTDGEGPRGS